MLCRHQVGPSTWPQERIPELKLSLEFPVGGYWNPATNNRVNEWIASFDDPHFSCFVERDTRKSHSYPEYVRAISTEYGKRGAIAIIATVCVVFLGVPLLMWICMLCGKTCCPSKDETGSEGVVDLPV